MAGHDHKYSNNYDIIIKSIIIITSLINGFVMIMMLIILLTKLITKKMRCVIKHYKCVNLKEVDQLKKQEIELPLLRERERVELY